MGKSISKYKLFMDLEKELAFINKMNKRGYKLAGIKLGFIYQFEKSDDGKYFTVIHAETPKKVRETVKAARQMGFEAIPHSGDGINELIYLTAKVGEAPEAFSDDNSSKIRLNENKIKAMKLPLAIYFVGFFACLIYLGVFCVDGIVQGEFRGDIVITCILSVMCLVWAALIIKFLTMIKKYKKDIKALSHKHEK